jgi:5-methylcytosine-specific restriction protein A
VGNRFATGRAELRVAALSRAGGTCEWVGCDVADGVEVHHIVPVAEGGSDDLRNLRVLCAEHHRQVRELRGRRDRFQTAR